MGQAWASGEDRDTATVGGRTEQDGRAPPHGALHGPPGFGDLLREVRETGAPYTAESMLGYFQHIEEVGYCEVGEMEGGFSVLLTAPEGVES